MATEPARPSGVASAMCSALRVPGAEAGEHEHPHRRDHKLEGVVCQTRPPGTPARGRSGP